MIMPGNERGRDRFSPHGNLAPCPAVRPRFAERRYAGETRFAVERRSRRLVAAPRRLAMGLLRKALFGTALFGAYK